MTVRVMDILKGFNEPISVGDSLVERQELYVVIALKISFALPENWRGQCVIQKVGSKRVSQNFEGKQDCELTFKNPPKKEAYPHPLRTGDFVTNKEGAAFEVKRINKIYYKFTDLVVSYDFKTIDEWTNAEINEVLQEERKRNFTVIKGLGTDESVNDQHKPNLRLVVEDSSNDDYNDIYTSKTDRVHKD